MKKLKSIGGGFCGPPFNLVTVDTPWGHTLALSLTGRK